MNCTVSRISYKRVLNSAIWRTKLKFIFLTYVFQNGPKMLDILKKECTSTNAVFQCLVVWRNKSVQSRKPSARRNYTKYGKANIRIWFGLPYLAELILTQCSLKTWASQKKTTKTFLATFSFPSFGTSSRTWFFKRMALLYTLLFLCVSIWMEKSETVA